LRHHFFCILLTLGLLTFAASSASAQDASPQLTKAPQVISQAEVDYPEASLKAGVEGEVVLEITVGADGKVSAAKVVSSPDEALGEAARQALLATTFSPAEIDGKPAAISFQYKLTFALPPSTLEAKVVEVSDGSQGDPKILPGAQVELLDEGGENVLATAFSDANGEVSFEQVPGGKYRLRVSLGERPTGEVEVKLGHGEVVAVALALSPPPPEPVEEISEDEIVDGEVRTTARKIPPDVTRRTITLEEVRRIPGTRGDVVRVVQNLPGVARPPAFSGQLVVRGAAPQDTRILLEGDVVPGVFHFLGGPAVVQSELIESVDFFPGNFGVQYGRATAGVLNLKTRDPREDKLHGFAQVDLLDSALLLEGPIIDGLSFAIAGRRSYIDVLARPFVPDDSFTFVLPRYYDYQGVLRLTRFDNHTVELLLYGSRDALRLIGEDENGEESEEESFGFINSFYRGQLRWDWSAPDAPMKNSLSVSFGTAGTRFEGGGFVFDTDQLSSIIREELTIKLAPRLDFRMGANFEIAHTDVEIVEPPTYDDSAFDSEGFSNNAPEDSAYPGDNLFITSLDPRSFVSPAFYTDLVIQPWKGAQIIPGLRLDYYGSITRLAPAPRLAMRQALFDEKLTLKGGVGLYTQAPQSLFTDPNFGTKKLEEERAMQYSLGFGVRPLKRLSVEIEGFYRDMSNLMVEDFELQFYEDGSFDYQFFDNDGEGRAYGLETLIKLDPQEGAFGWIAYTLSRSERLNLLTNEWDIYANDQTHILALVAGYKFPRDIYLSARFRVVSGFPFTPVDNVVYDADGNRYEPIYGKPNSARQDAFRQLDVRLEKSFKIKRLELAGYIDVLNATNRRNPESTFYTYDYSEQRVISGLPIIPNLGVNGRW
jgi:TonB family protein